MLSTHQPIITGIKEKLADIGNTILSTWPKYIEIVLGKFMPLDLQIIIPAKDYNKYHHAATRLIDFNEMGLHRYLTFPGIYNNLRRTNLRNLKISYEYAPGVIL